MTDTIELGADLGQQPPPIAASNGAAGHNDFWLAGQRATPEKESLPLSILVFHPNDRSHRLPQFFTKLNPDGSDKAHVEPRQET